MGTLSGKLKLVAIALGLLAIAHPALVPVIFGVIGVVLGAGVAIVAWFLVNISLTLTIAAGLVLAHLMPGSIGRTARWIGRALVASVAVVFPAKA
ncbi:hypothetical protein ABZ468_08050 [Streptomyces sp. NPDC005708]|uniref:hypothetical protein n=1 Tax=Streptomyces sp. NPDC005708 TaxID=3154564 RepID=UPI0033F9A3AF